MDWTKLRFPTVPVAIISGLLVVLAGLLLHRFISYEPVVYGVSAVLTVLLTWVLIRQHFQYKINVGVNGTTVITKDRILSPEDFMEAEVVARLDGRTIVLRTSEGEEAHFLAAHKLRKLNQHQVKLLGDIVLKSNIPDFEIRSPSLLSFGMKAVVPVTKEELTSMLAELHQLAS